MHPEKGTTKLVTGLEVMPCEEQMGTLGLSSLEGRRQRGDFTALSMFLKRGSGKGCAELFFLVFSDRAHGNSLKLCQRKFRLDISYHFFTERVTKHWNRPPKDVVGAPSLSVFCSYLQNSLNNRL